MAIDRNYREPWAEWSANDAVLTESACQSLFVLDSLRVRPLILQLANRPFESLFSISVRPFSSDVDGGDTEGRTRPAPWVRIIFQCSMCFIKCMVYQLHISPFYI